MSVSLGPQVTQLSITTGEQVGGGSIVINSSDSGDSTFELNIIPGGGVRLEPTIRLTCSAAKTMNFEAVQVQLASAATATREVFLKNASLSGVLPELRRLKVLGQCTVGLSADTSAATLVVYDDTKLFPVGRGTLEGLRVRRVTAPVKDDRARLIVAGAVPLNTVELSNCSVVIEDGASVAVSKLAINSDVRGPGEFRVETSGRNVHFKGGPSPVLVLAPYAVLLGASGRIRLGVCRDSQIVGDPARTLEIESLADVMDPETDLQGVTIRNFTTPVSVPGIRVLTAFNDKASIAAPAVQKSIPGQRDERKVVRKGTTDDLEDLRGDYATLLSQLATSKRASGATRTLLSWGDYRMRESNSSGLEWLALRAYRELGYGERALPALRTYILVSLSVALLTLGFGHEPDWSSEGAGFFFRTIGDWLLTPFHVLRLADPSSPLVGDNFLATIGRVLIAIPFVTGALSLRKYVKHD